MKGIARGSRAKCPLARCATVDDRSEVTADAARSIESVVERLLSTRCGR